MRCCMSFRSFPRSALRACSLFSSFSTRVRVAAPTGCVRRCCAWRTCESTRLRTKLVMPSNIRACALTPDPQGLSQVAWCHSLLLYPPGLYRPEKRQMWAQSDTKLRAWSYLASDIPFQIILVANVCLEVPQATRLLVCRHCESCPNKDCIKWEEVRD